MTRARLALGRRGEQLAAERLAGLGYTLVDQNVRSPYGEIDLVAQEAGTWVFVEVRTRRGRAFGLPEESVTPRKRRHLIAAAQHYVQAHDLADADWRIDLVAVELSAAGKLLRVDVIPNAIWGDSGQ